MEFTWDSAKNETNKAKHGISFELATHVFQDPERITFYDQEHSDDEDRYITLGKAGKVLFVVHTERGETTRIISARLADKKERMAYYGLFEE